MSGDKTPYTAKEIASNLKIGDSTLRKWCLALEEQNYNFIRTDQNKRMFSENDLFVLNQFKYLVQDKNMSINNAATIIATKYKEGVFSNETEIEQVLQPPLPNETLEELKAEMEQLKDMNRTLLNRLDEQHKYIEERLNNQDETLLTAIRESQETKKLIAAAREEEKNKGFFARLFGK